MEKQRALFISGGGAKIIFMASVAIQLIVKKGVKFQNIIGVSSGAILGILLAMGEYDEIEDNILNTKTSDIFKIAPNSLLGTLIAIWNILTGKTFLYNDNALRERLKWIITEDKFNRYKDDPEAPVCTIVAVDINSAEELLINIKKCSYHNAIEYILASSSVPVFVSGKNVIGKRLYDGGIRSHIGTASWLKVQNNVKKINECYAIYSRPESLENITWRFPTVKLWKKILFVAGLVYGFIIAPGLAAINLDYGWFIQSCWIMLNVSASAIMIIAGAQVNISKILQRTIEIMNIEISKSDYEQFGNICHKNMKRCFNIFAPYKLSTKIYENTEHSNAKMWNLGIQAVEQKPELWD